MGVCVAVYVWWFVFWFNFGRSFRNETYQHKSHCLESIEQRLWPSRIYSFEIDSRSYAPDECKLRQNQIKNKHTILPVHQLPSVCNIYFREWLACISTYFTIWCHKVYVNSFMCMRRMLLLYRLIYIECSNNFANIFSGHNLCRCIFRCCRKSNETDSDDTKSSRLAPKLCIQCALYGGHLWMANLYDDYKSINTSSWIVQASSLVEQISLALRIKAWCSSVDRFFGREGAKSVGGGEESLASHTQTARQISSQQ